MPPRFLDTNILLRYFTRDDPEKARRALALLLRVERGEERVDLSLIVVFETVFTLQRFYRVPRPQIRDLMMNILHLRAVLLPEKDLCQEALDIYATTNVSFADAYNAAYMKKRALTEVYSWDTDFDRFDGITRIEPPVEPTA